MANFRLGSKAAVATTFISGQLSAKEQTYRDPEGMAAQCHKLTLHVSKKAFYSITSSTRESSSSGMRIPSSFAVRALRTS
jgi:hypothetical protein